MAIMKAEKQQEQHGKLKMQLSLRTHFLVLKVPDPTTTDSQSARRYVNVYSPHTCQGWHPALLKLLYGAEGLCHCVG